MGRVKPLRKQPIRWNCKYLDFLFFLTPVLLWESNNLLPLTKSVSALQCLIETDNDLNLEWWPRREPIEKSFFFSFLLYVPRSQRGKSSSSHNFQQIMTFGSWLWMAPPPLLPHLTQCSACRLMWGHPSRREVKWYFETFGRRHFPKRYFISSPACL